MKSFQFHTMARQQGYNLVELMIAVFLGGILSAGALKMFSTSNANYNRLGDEVLQINNGQFISKVLEREIQLAGYMGQFINFQTVAYPLDVCSTDLAVLSNAVHHPMYGFDSPAGSPIGCLDDANFVPNTDILVIRRASTSILTNDNQPIDGGVYIQANTDAYELQIGKAGSFSESLLSAGNDVSKVGTTADGAAPTILKRANVAGANPLISGNRVAADVRAFRTDIYFVSPCTIPSDEGDVCTGPKDDGGSPEPSLKRLSLTGEGGAPGFLIEVIAEDVENMQVQYGIDESAPETLGSGVPNVYVNEPTNAQWPNVVNVNVSFLTKNSTRGSFLNEDVYDLGDGIPVGPFKDNFSRKVYQSNFRLVNVSMRREVPAP